MTVPIDELPSGWRKSTYSNGTGGSCVEVAKLLAGSPHVPIRDSKDVARGHLIVPSHAWAEFTDTIRV